MSTKIWFLTIIEHKLGLTPEEVEQLKTFKDTDDFIDFLENTKRDYSVKIHKTVAFRAEINQKRSEFGSSSNYFFIFHDA